MGKATLYGFVPEFGVDNIQNRLGIDSLPLKKKLGASGKNRVSRFRNMDVIPESNGDDPQAALERMESLGTFNVQESFLPPITSFTPPVQILLNEQQEQEQDPSKEFSDKYSSVVLGEEIQNLFDKNLPVFPSNSRSMLRYAHKNYKKVRRQRELSEKERRIQIVRRPARRESLLEETGVLFS